MVRTNETTIRYTKVNDVMVIVRNLRKDGLIQGVDFDFAMHGINDVTFYFSNPVRKTWLLLTL